VNESARRSARSALDTARPAIARLDPTRDAEDVAADLIEGWSAVETALRSLVGGSALSGQALIRDARARQMLGFEQANALAEFHAAADRAHRTDYEPSDADVDAARNAFLKFEASLMASDTAAAPTGRSATAVDPVALAAPPPPPMVASGGLGIPSWAVMSLVILLFVGVGAAGWYLLAGRNNDDAYTRGVDYYRRGQREAAVGEFTKAARDDPNDPMPHVYLSRMAREVGNYTLSLQEANLAVQAGPNRLEALREMGSYLLTVGNFDLARRFFIRAVAADTTDRASQGWLGCSLVRLGRTAEGMSWITRAGQGA
jgi:tetratricopeptide (TPR) repeat protein